MSDEAEVEQLLENFQKALDTLNNIGNVEALITKLDAHRNRKLLKRVKHVVNEVHSKVGTVKEKVSKAYKRVKIRSSSESDEVAIAGNTLKDGSDKEDLLDFSENIDNVDRCSPIFDGKGKNPKRSAKQTDKSGKNNTEQNILPSFNTSSDTNSKETDEEIDDVSMEGQEDPIADKLDGIPVKGHENPLENDGVGASASNNPDANDLRKTDSQVDAEAGTDQTIYNEIEKNHESDNSEEIIESTPEKSPDNMYLFKNKTKSNESSLFNALLTEKSNSSQYEAEKVKSKESENLSQIEKNINKKKDDKRDSDSESETSKNRRINQNKRTTDKKNDISGDDSDQVVEIDTNKNDTSDNEEEKDTFKKSASKKKSKHCTKRVEELNEESNSETETSKDSKTKSSIDEEKYLSDNDKAEELDKTSRKTRGKKEGKNDRKDDDVSNNEAENFKDAPKKCGTKKIKHSKRRDESKSSNIDKTQKMEESAKISLHETNNPSDDDKSDTASDDEKNNKQKCTDISHEAEIATQEDTSKKARGEENKNEYREASSDSETADPKLTNNLQKTKENEIKNRPPIPKIKLVDINKLLAPNTKPLEVMSPLSKTKKSVTFDSSVIILSSSDEETPKKDPKSKYQSPLKSAMRKSSSKEADNSDSDSKENNENLKNKKSTKQSRHILTSDNSSDDFESEFSRRSRRLQKTESALKDKFSKFATKYGERKSRAIARRSLRGHDELDSDKEDLNERRKKKRTKDKKLHSDSDDYNEKDNTDVKNKKLQRKKDILEISSTSEQSENSDSDSTFKVPSKRKSGPKSRNTLKRAKVTFKEPDQNDPKFKAKVYIGLPLFKCEELQDIYKRKKETFEVKKLTKMDFTRRTRSTRNGSSKNSDDLDKPEQKRIKLTLKLKKNYKLQEDDTDVDKSSKGDSVVDEESNTHNEKESRLEVDSVDVSDCSVAIEDSLAEACLEQIKDNSDEAETDKQSEESESEEDTHTKKKDKKNKKRRKKDNEFDKDGSADANEKSAKKLKDKEPKVNGILSDSDNHSDENAEDDKKQKKDDSADEEEGEKRKGKKSKDKLLTQNIDSSDSDENFANFSRKKDKTRSELVRKAKKRMKKSAVISDSDSDENRDNEQKSGTGSDEDYKAVEKSSGSDSGSEKEEKDEDSDQDQEKKPARKRIKRVKDSSSDDDDRSTRKHLRKMIDRDSLSETTKKAEQNERERKARIADKQKKYNQIFDLKADATVDKVVLDFDEKTDKALLSVSKKLVKQLKPHQVHGIKFMWDACFESLERLKKDKGSGCILAHCMGLGKTLQVIALSHTLLSNSDKTNVEKVMVVCPVNTVLNWKSEFKKWLPKNEFEVYELVSCKTSSVNHERNYQVREWYENGGILIIGYNMFRSLSNPDNKTISKKLRQSFQEGLVDPGPDLVVCDEGHLLKNEKTNLSIAMNRIKTQRRIVLTGTPLQNNLKEYWCMVQFIKPNLLGTYKEYMNRFVNPITNGQYTDSTQHDIVIMRRRSHVLHKLLDGVVQRQDYSVLEPYLPPKYEYVLFLKLTEVQIKLYTHYMEHFARRSDGSNRTSFLFTDFQQLQRMCTHPRVLFDKSHKDKKEKDLNDESDSEGSLKEFIDDDSEAEASSTSSGAESKSDSDASVKSDEKKKKKSSNKKKRLTRAQAAQKRDNEEESDSEVEVLEQKEWWQEYVDNEELDNINHSAKTFLLFEILKECEEIGDKVLVFSQSLYTLNCLEYFLQRIDEATQKGETEKVGGHSGSWAIGLDYFRLDGSSSCDNRASWCDQFNDPENTRARLFLISTKAGGLGINLIAANRVIIFDVSWNPSHDIQSIYRVYRFGQTKPSYVYRFVTYGTMEMKIYERQVTKQAISKRVIDEQQIDRHYSQNDIQELYNTDLDPKDRPIPLVPKDVLLGEMLQKYDKTIFKYHEHQSLLENKQDEELNEDERKAAWEEFENEKVVRKTSITNFGGINLAAFQNSMNFSPQLIQVALANIVRKDNPAWSEVQIRGILPALVTQLQMQMSENDFSMYNRVQQEVRLMQALQAQRMRENYIKQYQLQQILQKQQMTNQMLGNLNVNPEELRRLQIAASQNYIHPSLPKNTAGGSGDVIELND